MPLSPPGVIGEGDFSGAARDFRDWQTGDRSVGEVDLYLRLDRRRRAQRGRHFGDDRPFQVGKASKPLLGAGRIVEEDADRGGGLLIDRLFDVDRRRRVIDAALPLGPKPARADENIEARVFKRLFPTRWSAVRSVALASIVSSVSFGFITGPSFRPTPNLPVMLPFSVDESIGRICARLHRVDFQSDVTASTVPATCAVKSDGVGFISALAMWNSAFVRASGPPDPVSSVPCLARNVDVAL